MAKTNTLVKLDLPEDLHYQLSVAAKASKMSLEDYIADRMEVFKDFTPATRWLTIPPKQREELESYLGGRHLNTSDTLVSEVKKLSTFKFGEIELTWSSEQIAEVERRAARNNRSLKDELAMMAKLMMPLFFYSGGYAK